MPAECAGCLINARPIGVLWAVDANEGERDDEIVHFFTVHGDMQGKQLGLDGWGTHDDAMQLIEKGRRRASRVEQ